MHDEIESPCTGVCRLDEEQICVGCLRSMAEIVAWPESDRAVRLRILHSVAMRRHRREKQAAAS